MILPRFWSNLTLPALALLGLALTLDAGEPLSVSSPDGAIELQMPAVGSAPDGHWSDFQVRFRGRVLLQGELGLAVRRHDPLEQAVQKGSRVRASDTTYTVPFGKSNPVRDHFNELTLDLETAAGPVRKIQLVFRAYDDGVAFRYVVPEQAGVESIEIMDEPARFDLTGNPQTWPLYRENYTTSHEGLYAPARLSELATNQLIDLPFLAQYEDGICTSTFTVSGSRPGSSARIRTCSTTRAC
jgi:alpha-glucosidase